MSVRPHIVSAFAGAVVTALVLTLLGHSHHLAGRWWEGRTLDERLAGQLHLRRDARAALRELDSSPLAVRRPLLTGRAERRYRNLLAVLRREIPETRQALAEAAAAASRAAEDALGRASASAGGGFDDGSYNCGLQFADGWMDVYDIRCGDPASQIAAAEAIAQSSSGDPWPNCPDPYDGSGTSWEDTVACENGGRW